MQVNLIQLKVILSFSNIYVTMIYIWKEADELFIDFQDRIDWIDMVYSIKLLEHKVQYLLNKDPEYSNKDLFSSSSDKIDPEDCDRNQNIKGRSVDRLEKVLPFQEKEEESKVHSELNKKPQFKLSSIKNPSIRRLFKYKIVEDDILGDKKLLGMDSSLNFNP